MKTKIYIEGGGDSKELHSRCREGFSRLPESSGFKGRMPQLIACGPRDSAYRDFKTANSSNNADYVAMLVDSEEPVSNPEDTWIHLMKRDGWGKTG